jgi:hypothetical protein
LPKRREKIQRKRRKKSKKTRKKKNLQKEGENIGRTQRNPKNKENVLHKNEWESKLKSFFRNRAEAS